MAARNQRRAQRQRNAAEQSNFIFFNALQGRNQFKKQLFFKDELFTTFLQSFWNVVKKNIKIETVDYK